MSRKKEKAPDLVIDDGQVYQTSERSAPAKPKRRNFLKGMTRRLKPIYIGPLKPDQSGMLNVRGHLGFMVACLAVAAAGFAIFEAIPLLATRGFYCPSIAVPFGLLAVGLANSEYSAMRHKSIARRTVNGRLCQLGLVLGGIAALAGVCMNVLGIVFYFGQ